METTTNYRTRAAVSRAPQCVLTVDGRPYPLAPRTLERARRLAAVDEGAPDAPFVRLQILLGEEACRALFPMGEEENLDRAEMIEAAALDLWNGTAERTSHLQSVCRELSDALAPVTALLDRLNTLTQNSPRVIRRGAGSETV